jgi:antitoxin component YwqK of YwqJK toxin-antitoxin module
MRGKPCYANGQPAFRQDGDILTYFFRTGLKKAEGASVNGVMQGEWRFWRETGELWQVGHFHDGAKHGPWVCYGRDGGVEKTGTFDNGKAVKGRTA